MNIIFLICVLLSCVESKVSVDVLKKVCSQLVSGEKHGLYGINLDGPLNFLLGYIYITDHIISNKRLYAPEIFVDYDLYFEDSNEIYRYDSDLEYIPPDRSKDKVFKDYKLNHGDYETGFYKTFLHMFMVDGSEIVINTTKKTSFYQFLLSIENQKELAKLFAALLLLGEGVPVPLTIEKLEKGKHPNKKLPYLILTGRRRGFEIPLFTKINNFYDGEDLQTRNGAKAVLQFFMKKAPNWDGNKLGTEPIKQFESGYFMYSPTFLLQSYIYEFVAREEVLKEIILCYNELLEDFRNKIRSEEDDMLPYPGIPKESNLLEIYDRVHKRSFVSTTNITEPVDLKYFNYIEKLTNDLTKNSNFPFSPSNHPPQFVDVRRMKRISNSEELDTFELLPDKTYSNCCETMLYSFLCCLFYDPNTRLYSVDHLPAPSNELREFFKEYPDPLEVIFDYDFILEWGKVIVDLRADEIRYVKCDNQARNELDSGWLNILRVIFKITGYAEEYEKIKLFEENLSLNRPMSEESLENFMAFISNAFQKLSLSSIANLEFKNLRNALVEKRLNKTGKEMDIFGNIEVAFSVEGTNTLEKIELNMSIIHAAFTYVTAKLVIPKNEIESWDNLISNIKEERCLLGELVANKIKMLVNPFDLTGKNLMLDKVISHKSLRDKYAQFNLFFLYGPFDQISVKAKAIEFFLPYLVKESKLLEENDVIVRFTSNIIASEPLNDAHTRNKLLGYLILYDKNCLLFPTIYFPITTERQDKDPDYDREDIMSFLDPEFRDDTFELIKSYGKYDLLFRYLIYRKRNWASQNGPHFDDDTFGQLLTDFVAVQNKEFFEIGFGYFDDVFESNGPLYSMQQWFEWSSGFWKSNYIKGVTLALTHYKSDEDELPSPIWRAKSTIRNRHMHHKFSNILIYNKDALLELTNDGLYKLIILLLRNAVSKHNFDGMFYLVKKYYDEISYDVILNLLFSEDAMSKAIHAFRDIDPQHGRLIHYLNHCKKFYQRVDQLGIEKKYKVVYNGIDNSLIQKEYKSSQTMKYWLQLRVANDAEDWERSSFDLH